ncbi:MAG TPA: serine hydrolase [Candidatus Hydrogenedentes bacterium]|nr:serine hydrolase [Candidatus Hydrogenedentota bacterium]
MKYSILLLVFIGNLASLPLAHSDTLCPRGIPRLENIIIDGSPNDWDNAGFQVNVMPDKDGRLLPKHDLNPRFRLAWGEQGLLFLVTVDDDVLQINSVDSEISNNDSVEVFIGPRPGTKAWCRFVFTPENADGGMHPRQHFTDFSKKFPRKEPVKAELASAKTPAGYLLEGRIPWTTLRRTPKKNNEIALQLYVNDTDGTSGRFQSVWYPSNRTAEDSNHMYRVRLACKASAPENERISNRYDGKGRTCVQVMGADALANQSIRVYDGRHLLAKAKLELRGDWVGGEVTFPMPSPGHDFGALNVKIDGKRFATLELPNADIERGKALLTTEIAARPSVFSGMSFPTLEPRDPLVLENFIGKYRIETEFYDAGYNLVEMAGSAGRYGAIVHIIPKNGSPLTRFVSLYRAPDSYDPFKWWFFTPSFSNPYPANLGINPLTLEQESGALDLLGRQQLMTLWNSDWSNASLVAGLAEHDPRQGVTSCADNAWARDRQWWVGLKRKLYGNNQACTQSFVCPRPIAGSPAPVLREGSPDEAGMQPGIVDSLDALLKEWAQKSGEPFAVCLARQGVVFFHRAYGERGGKPMTVTTKSWMASISKMVSGVMMMTVADQRLTTLDAPVADYLPPFRAVKVETPLTIRSLYTHTNDLILGIQLPLHYMDHWGDEMHDLDQRIAEFYPLMKVGKALEYNGVGYALGGKVMEAVTGEALPQLYKKHLLEPLGMDHTDVTDASARTFSIPMDMAKLGQMLLNKGAYGNMRFFSEPTYEKMLPRPLSEFWPAIGDVQWGIGTVSMKGPGLSKSAFGHGAASCATFIVDPENQLVISMTRNTAGPLFQDYQPKFIEVITAGIIK